MRNILIINGSPKGAYSITVHTCLFLQKKFPEYNFDFINPGQTPKKFLNDFSEAAEAIKKADLLIFSYPVYTFMCPSQLHFFINKMKDQKLDLSQKFATQISTSKHFYDITAHKYIQDNCQEMGLKYLKGLSADMDDLTKKSGQEEAVEFFRKTLWSVENNVFEPSPASPLPYKQCLCTLENLQKAQNNLPSEEKSVALITDSSTENPNLQSMIERFKNIFPYKVKLFDISKMGIKGGCISCFNCAATGNCIYKDGYQETLRNEILTSDAMVFAFTIKDHSMGPLFKMYDDRQFCNGHRTVSRGKSIGYLISGNYSSETNLHTLIEARAEVGGTFLAGVATDEKETDLQIDNLSKTLAYAIENKYSQSSNFYGVGGMKIFRDLIYIMGGLMKEDYKFYKKNGQFDFPQKQKKTRFLMKLVGLLMTPKLMAKAGDKMKEGMIGPYKKVLDNIHE